MSQEELAQRMTDRGFGFSQATIWKIEQGKRPVRIGEAAAFSVALGMLPVTWTSLFHHPDLGRHEVQIENAHRRAGAAYEAIKQATDDFLEAQADLAFAVHDARTAGVGVHELFTVWFGEPAERAVIETRVEREMEDTIGIELNEAVGKIVASLREHGYDPIRSADEVTADGPDHTTLAGKHPQP